MVENNFHLKSKPTKPLDRSNIRGQEGWCFNIKIKIVKNTNMLCVYPKCVQPLYITYCRTKYHVVQCLKSKGIRIMCKLAWNCYGYCTWQQHHWLDYGGQAETEVGQKHLNFFHNDWKLYKLGFLAKKIMYIHNTTCTISLDLST